MLALSLASKRYPSRQVQADSHGTHARSEDLSRHQDFDRVAGVLAGLASGILERRGFKTAPGARMTTPRRLDSRPRVTPRRIPLGGDTLSPTGSPLRSPAADAIDDGPDAWRMPDGSRAGPQVQLTDGRLSLKPTRASDGVRAAPVWLKSVWRKPAETAVFERTRQSIPTALPVAMVKTSIEQDADDQEQTYLHRLNRDQLGRLQVIGQLDRKFIVCAVPEATGSTSLVLFDQHAVDERIRVERLLGEACQGFASGDIETQYLGDDPHQLLLASRDAELLSPTLPFARIIRRWGIHLEVDQGETDHGTDLKQLNITAVPALLAQRLAANSAQDVKKLVLSYLGFLEDQGFAAVAAMADKLDQGIEIDESVALRWLPQRMLDLITSRACRGE